MFITVEGVRLSVFTLYNILAITLSVLIAGYHLRRSYPLPTIADLLTAAVVLGVIGARAEYAALNWDVFAADWRTLIDARPGGLGWHGAAFGAWLGITLAARWHKLDTEPLIAALAPALPLIAFASWTACRSFGCVYGTEVETLALYPAWLVTEGRDIFGIIAPRYDTHTFGQALAWSLLVIVGVLWISNAQRIPPAAITWGIWITFCIGMLLIGMMRSDQTPRWLGMRADQWLDIALGGGALAQIIHLRHRFRRCPTESSP